MADSQQCFLLLDSVMLDNLPAIPNNRSNSVEPPMFQHPNPTFHYLWPLEIQRQKFFVRQEALMLLRPKAKRTVEWKDE